MAVDTRDKRMSIMGVSLSWRGGLPTPDGTIGAADRQIFPYYYSGILWDAPVTPVLTSKYNNPMIAFMGKMMNR